MQRIKVWDIPVRLVHWSIVLLVPALWLSAENGKADLHMTLGLTMLGLVVFRLLWGLFGSSTARFSDFVRGPGKVLAYLRGQRSGGGDHAPVVGHNPLGGWSVMALLGLLAAQVGVGLFVQDEEGLEVGPLNHLVSYDTGEALLEVHELIFNLLVVLVVIHVAAIVWYAVVKKDRLVPPMITGVKDLPEGTPAPRIAHIGRAIPLVLLAAALAWWIGKGAPTSLAELQSQPVETTAAE